MAFDPPTSARRAIEFAMMFIVAPAALALFMRPGLLFPALWLLGAVGFGLLWTDPEFDRRLLWGWGGVKPALRGIGAWFVTGAIALTALLLILDPGRLLVLPRSKPALWGAIMVLYPVASVFPQEVAFRAFIFHRYSRVFRGQRSMVLASALAFGYAHIILHNWWAVGLSTIGASCSRGRTPDRDRWPRYAWNTRCTGVTCSRSAGAHTSMRGRSGDSEPGYASLPAPRPPTPR